MVNANKHRALLQDTETRVHKRLNKILCNSNNAKKNDIQGDKVLLSNCGRVGREEIIRTNNKRATIKRGLIYGFD